MSKVKCSECAEGLRTEERIDDNGHVFYVHPVCETCNGKGYEPTKKVKKGGR